MINKPIIFLVLLVLLLPLMMSCGSDAATSTPAITPSTTIESTTPIYSNTYTPQNIIVTPTSNPIPTRQYYNPTSSVYVPSTTVISTNGPIKTSNNQPLPAPPSQILSTTSPEQFLVTRVFDGDTIEVNVSGQTKSVRYIGINTPEISQPNKPAEPFSKDASDKNRVMVEGRYVKLEKDISEIDQFGRLLRYVYVDGIFVNAELIRLGFAQVYSWPPDTKYQDLLVKLEKEAKDNKRGLWGLTTAKATSAPTKSLTLAIDSVTSPVKRGDNAKLTARTAAGAQCEIAVYYKSGKSSASGLTPKTPDAGGNVSWTWTVGSSTTVGNWKIEVTASLNGQSSNQTTYFTVN